MKKCKEGRRITLLWHYVWRPRKNKQFNVTEVGGEGSLLDEPQSLKLVGKPIVCIQLLHPQRGSQNYSLGCQIASRPIIKSTHGNKFIILNYNLNFFKCFFIQSSQKRKILELKFWNWLQKSFCLFPYFSNLKFSTKVSY